MWHSRALCPSSRNRSHFFPLNCGFLGCELSLRLLRTKYAGKAYCFNCFLDSSVHKWIYVLLAVTKRCNHLCFNSVTYCWEVTKCLTWARSCLFLPTHSLSDLMLTWLSTSKSASISTIFFLFSNYSLDIWRQERLNEGRSGN